MQDIATKIRELRGEAGISLTQLAEKAELSLGYLSKLESGEYKDLSLKSSKALAKGLGLSLKDFLQRMGFLDNHRERPSLQLITQALRSNGYTDEQADQVITYARFLKKQTGDK